MEKKYMYMWLKKKNSFLILVCFFFAASVSAQFSVKDYISAPFQDAEVVGLVRQMEYMDSESFRSPLFREVQLRIRTNDVNFSPDDIRFRLGLLNPLEQKANRILEKSQKDYLQVKYEYESSKILAKRYKQLIRHFYLCRSEKMLQEDIGKLSAAYKQIELSSEYFVAWVETDEDILQKEMQRQDILTDISLMEFAFQEILQRPDSISWEHFDFISVERMQEVLLPDTIILSDKERLALKNFEMEQQSFELEKAESRSSIGYIQAQYDLDGLDDINDDLGFQLGINLPLFNSDKPKLQRKKLELMDEEFQMQETSREVSFDKYELNALFQKHVLKYQFLSRRLSEIEKLAGSITYNNTEEFIALAGYHAGVRSSLLEVYRDCLDTYIDILQISGRLSRNPEVNYISSSLQLFSF